MELPADFQFSFNYNNGVFAFENLQLSRSGEFSIPRTPVNDIILEFSHDASKDGQFVRNRKAAELYYSGGKIDGYIYVSKFSGGEVIRLFSFTVNYWH